MKLKAIDNLPRSKYVMQRDPYRCGPIAVINAIKWAGDSVSGRNMLPTLTTIMGCHYKKDAQNNGTPNTCLDIVLRVIGEDLFKVKKVMRPTLKEIDRHIKQGGAIVMNFCWKKNETGGSRHYDLIIDHRKDGGFVIANGEAGPGNALWSISRKHFKKSRLKYKTIRHWAYKAWFLTKVN